MRLCYREIVTRDNQRPHAAEPTVLIDHRPESRSFHIFYDCDGENDVGSRSPGR